MTEQEKRQIAAEFLGHIVLGLLEQLGGNLHAASTCIESDDKKEIDAGKRIVAVNIIEAEKFYCASEVLSLLDISRATLHRWRSGRFFPDRDELRGDRHVWSGETLLSWIEWCNEFNLKSPSDVNSDTTPFIDWA